MSALPSSPAARSGNVEVAVAMVSLSTDYIGGNLSGKAFRFGIFWPGFDANGIVNGFFRHVNFRLQPWLNTRGHGRIVLYFGTLFLRSQGALPFLRI